MHGFADFNGTLLGVNYPGAADTYVTGVDVASDVVGNYVDKNGVTHGFSYNFATYTPLDPPGATATYPAGINDAGAISGRYIDGNDHAHLFVDSNGTFSTVDYPGAVGTLGGAINDSSQFVGNALLDGGTNAGFLATPVCFASGTAIRTVRGDVAVEALAVGDQAITALGASRPITWVGHRTINCRRHPRDAAVLPIRIAAHAFGLNRPARDLFVSPGHAICVDIFGEVLIPAGTLVNGSTIQQVEVDEVTYWHVELDSHDIVLAENLPCESYLEMGNRGFFREAAVIDFAAGPDLVSTSPRTHADFCRPFHANGPVVEAAQARLLALAGAWRMLSQPRRQATNPDRVARLAI